MPQLTIFPIHSPAPRSRRRRRLRGASPPPVGISRHYLAGRGKWRRVAAPEYRFFRDNSAPPAIDDTPFDSNPTLPYTPADTYADGTWYISMAYFNGVFLSDFFPVGPNDETYYTLVISAGDEVANGPNAPYKTSLAPLAAGVVRACGFNRVSRGDGTHWAVSYTVDGSTPPADAHDYIEEITADLTTVFRYDLPAQSEGTTVKARIMLARNDGTEGSPVWFYSDADVLTATAIVDGPTQPLGASTS